MLALLYSIVYHVYKLSFHYVFFFIGCFSLEDTCPLWIYFKEERSIAVKLFVLGKPGCGKSTIADYIRLLVEAQGWVYKHDSDYPLLRNLFLQEKKNPSSTKQFEATSNGGFNVLDHALLDLVLENLAKKYTHKNFSGLEKTILVLEFARSNYQRALRLFGQDFLKSSHFLYLHTDLETCRKRIDKRVTERKSENDHYVSEETLQKHYLHFEGPHPQEVLTEFTQQGCNTLFLDNNQDLILEALPPEVEQFVLSILENSTSVAR